MVIGGNPLVSVTNLDLRNPMKRLKDAKARGFKLIVIDPRLTETAKFADIFLQPLPGEDCTILAGMIRLILERGWEDTEFCAQNAADSMLKAAVEPFTPDYVATPRRHPGRKTSGATKAFAHAKRGPAISATGPNMSPHSNLAEHLIGCLNVICGRYRARGRADRESRRALSALSPPGPGRPGVAAMGERAEEPHRRLWHAGRRDDDRRDGRRNLSPAPAGCAR
jgi:anaerobic selenocysteine-containing dehydrogenase